MGLISANRQSPDPHKAAKPLDVQQSAGHFAVAWRAGEKCLGKAVTSIESRWRWGHSRPTRDVGAMADASIIAALLQTINRQAQFAVVARELLDDSTPRRKRCRRVYERPDYRRTAWMTMLDNEAQLLDPTSREAKKFRRRFRLPYPMFKELVALVREKGWLPCADADVAGRPCIPLELKPLRENFKRVVVSRKPWLACGGGTGSGLACLESKRSRLHATAPTTSYSQR
ncbi:hypothetical protein JKP88DRAFT_266780 [Tribonema minus]|uniref:Uncharacterized protein n=1 Tax=Tribonema minus TaxID=303371 RepID=A0A835ZBP5_9STRA|nr:hypothetical protein JKP88DRAFT_266780 [Tribonema minus]